MTTVRLWAATTFYEINVFLSSTHHLPSRHANASRQRIRHGLSRYRPRYRSRPAAGLRARLALRLPRLVGGARAADKEASRHCGILATLLSRALGRYR